MKEIVIRIPEKEYEVILNNNYVAVCACPHLLSEAIKNGTPLPKGHGRLIDADSFLAKYETCGYIEDMEAEYFNAVTPTIIEADKENKNTNVNDI